MSGLVEPRSLQADLLALRDGALDPAGCVHRGCDRIDHFDPQIQAFVPEPGRRARLLDDAANLEKTANLGGAANLDKAANLGGAAGPIPGSLAPEDWALYGILVGVKDVIRVDGLETRAGSALPAETFRGPQATVVSRMLAQGALVAGKTVTAEFAVTAPGPTANPHDLRHTPGGSSSGSAAAVAAGMVPLALGTQTIGSVIRPAAFCGVVGFKTSWGRIPTDGIIPFAPTLDAVGLFAADVASAAVAAAVVCDDWQGDLGDVHPPVLGIPTGRYLERASSEALGAFAEQVATLRAAGLTVREVPMMDDFDEVVEQLFVINRFELARGHAGWFAEFGPLYREQTAAAVRQAQAIAVADYTRALRWRETFIDRMTTATRMAGIDLWISPAATGPAPRGLDTTGDSVMSVPSNLAGMPTVSLPAGTSAAGLPLGLQCVALPGHDERLLAWSAILESVLPDQWLG